MSNYSFSIQQQPIFGTYGEFSVGVGESKVSAKYLLTKIRPGNQGSWENHLASKMAPWREIFQVEELSFDELIQRDLDDSRVAHDMIPYLLGETGHNARFFPPVLAVLVPRKEKGSGISANYPKPVYDGGREVFGDLFNFEQVKIDGQASPLGVINYNSQKTAMVIVDGQHRAMAVLALHRQLNKSWQADPFSPYYHHVEVTPEAVEHIELPVCIVYFPDIFDGNEEIKDAGIDLTTVCREIFTVVNKSAKPVGKSRELLLNDEDFAAFMMRRTLTKLKGQPDSGTGHARIYSFAFGDDEGSTSGQGLAGRLEYSSAVAIHKMHGAVGFALPAAFGLIDPSDVTDGRFVRNSTRPVDLLTGEIKISSLKSISKRAAKTHRPDVVEVIVNKIGDLTDAVMFPLFNELRPFSVHNESMRELLEALNDPAARADLIQCKCKALLFEGSGARVVFEEHADRLQRRKDELVELGSPVPPHLESQIIYCDSVSKALEQHEDNLKLKRAFKLFNIDSDAFRNRDKDRVEDETRFLRSVARSIFDTVSTQAFQIGYLMAVFTAVDRMTSPDATYEQRLKNTKFVSELYLSGLNTLFSVEQTRHKTLNGYVTQPRARVFDSSAPGFRSLLQAGNVRELNEKQWVFFRFLVLEVVHSKRAFEKVNKVLSSQDWAEQADAYRGALRGLLSGLSELRVKYFEAAVRSSLNSEDFKRQLLHAEVEARAKGKGDEEIKRILEGMSDAKREEIEKVCSEHLAASLGEIESLNATLKRFGVSAALTEGKDSINEALSESAVMEKVVSEEKTLLL